MCKPLCSCRLMPALCNLHKITRLSCQAIRRVPGHLAFVFGIRGHHISYTRPLLGDPHIYIYRYNTYIYIYMNSVYLFAGTMRCETSLRSFKKRGRPAPHLQTECLYHGFEKFNTSPLRWIWKIDNFYTSVTDAVLPDGANVLDSTPCTAQKESRGLGGAADPPLQTQCTYMHYRF